MASLQISPRFRRRSATPPAEPDPRRALDRSTLLAELEVSVPAPERVVRWDSVTKECGTCTMTVARAATRCRHCGAQL